MLKHTVNKVQSLRDLSDAADYRTLKHTVNKVSSLRDFSDADDYRTLKHTVNKVSSLRDLSAITTASVIANIRFVPKLKSAMTLVQDSINLQIT
jgi:hypothetical protein